MSKRTGYLIINLTNLDMKVYTHKKGVMDVTGASRRDMINFKDKLLIWDYFIRRVDIETAHRSKVS